MKINESSNNDPTPNYQVAVMEKQHQFIKALLICIPKKNLPKFKTSIDLRLWIVSLTTWLALFCVRLYISLVPCVIIYLWVEGSAQTTWWTCFKTVQLPVKTWPNPKLFKTDHWMLLPISCQTTQSHKRQWIEMLVIGLLDKQKVHPFTFP